MFMRKSTLKKLLFDLLGKGNQEIKDLLGEAKALIGPAGDVSKLKKEIAELCLQKTMDEREIKQLVAFQKRQDVFFEQVMTRLPDVSVLLGETVKAKGKG